MSSESRSIDECCPEFNPLPWDNQTFEWVNKKFIRDKVCTFFYMPVSFGKVMKRLDDKVRSAGAKIPDWLCLSEHTSKWNMNVYLAVDRDISEAENITLNGKFFSKVYEGSFKDSGKWCKDYEEDAKSKGFNIKKMYMWYTTCPKCAKKYGKNYVVIVSEIE
jgi:hypothetical protein